MGARLRAVRELTGASTREVAKSAGLSRRELEAAERGAKRLAPEQLHALAGALGVDSDVLVGVGFEGELVRAGEVEDRSDHIVGRDPERRRDHETRQRIEQSWREVRDEMGDTLGTCARLLSAGAGDDVRSLIARLDQDLQQLKSHGTFEHHLTNHERAVAKVRGTGGNFRGLPLASSVNEAR